MANTKTDLTEATLNNLRILGQQIKNARLRRNIKASVLAKDAGIGINTLHSIEMGTPGVSIGKYAAVLSVMDGLDKDFQLVAQNDYLGRRLQDEKLPKRARPEEKENNIKVVIVKKKR